MAHSKRLTPKYVYDIPYLERMELCRILDQNEKWEELGGIHMEFDVLTIQMLRKEVLRGNSPTDELLTKWGHQNHTILELFVLLSKMQHYQAMLIIKQFVDTEYHKLIYEGEQNFNRLFKLEAKSDLNSTNTLNGKFSQGHKNLEDSVEEEKVINGQEPGSAVHSYKLRDETSRNNVQTALLNRDDSSLPVDNQEHNQNPIISKFLKPDTAKDKNVSEMSSIVESVGILPIITFKELELATNGWDPITILGKGGFGTVYKGTWKNTSVAIKRTRNSDADENHSIQIQQILGELKMLNSYRHDNILPLYGFSMDGEDPCLIYQFLPNGSLEDRLLCRHGTKPLSWYQRLNIATGTARGIQFLHTIGEKPLIHGDIKSANILLDLNFEPKIGDFGLAREGPYNHYTHMKVSRVHGTRPYLPDEFLRHKKFSTKVDTYSFGVVLFELATGLRSYDEQRQHKFLKDHIENTSASQYGAIMDKRCGPDEYHTFPNLIELGKSCVSRKPKDRPEMVVALQDLNGMVIKRDMLIRVQSMLRQNNLTPSTPFEMQAHFDHLTQQKKTSPVTSNATHLRAPTRALSPLPEQQIMNNAASLEAQAAVAAAANANMMNNNNPFLPLDKNLSQTKDLKVLVEEDVEANNGSTTPETNLKKAEPLGDHSNREFNGTNNFQYKTPVISISPPTNSSSSSSEIDECASTGVNMVGAAAASVPPLPVVDNQAQGPSDEDLDYVITSDIEKFLPLISVLGVKGKTNESKERKKNKYTFEKVSNDDADDDDDDEHEEDDEQDDEEVDSSDLKTSAAGKHLWILPDSPD